MPRPSTVIIPGIAFASCLFPLQIFASETGLLAQARGGGGYLAWYKLLMVAVVFLIWVRLADWVNRDSMKLHEDTGMAPEVWNPVNVFSFIVGFFCAISIPMFVAGYPILLLAAFVPTMIYWMMRRSAFKDDPRILDKARAKPGVQAKMRALPQDEGANISFTPAGVDKNEQQGNLIRARQTPTFLQLKELISHSIKSRAEQIVIDYTRDAVTSRMQVDGTWHQLPPVDRLTGDSLLLSLKYLAGLNAQDRRSLQQGNFQAKMDGEKTAMELITQGTQTGERVQLKFEPKFQGQLTVNQLGMLPEMSVKLKSVINRPGLVIVSSPPGSGLSTSWAGILGFSDRITRDAVALIDVNDRETAIENITPHLYDSKIGETPMKLLRKVLLAQPDCLVVPQVPDAETLDALLAEANEESRTIITQIKARSASEALLRFYALTKNRDGFKKAVNVVTGQRLFRRLCDTCKVPVQVQPNAIQQLGGDPRTQNTIFNPYRLPPPEQQVDEAGKPVEMLPCPVCQGLGYIGRVAAFEAIFVTEAIREVLRVNPKVEAIESAAQKEGKLSMIAQGYQLVLLGITSVAEIQRVMKS